MADANAIRAELSQKSAPAFEFDTIHDRSQFGSVKWANQWDEFSPCVEGDNLLSLWTADMDFRTPETVITRLREAAEHGIYGYTRRDPRHYEIVRAWFKSRHGWSPSVETLLPAPAIMPTVATILRTFTEPGDGVIVQSPVYSPYYEVVRGNGRRLLVNRLVLNGSRYDLDLDDFGRLAAEGARAFLLCNPHNPAGRAWTREELTALNTICERHGILVISDDIHCDIRLADRRHIVLASISESAAERSFICTAPTKTFNLAGVPSANVSVANSELRRALFAAMQASFMFNANYFGRLALEVAYSTGAPWLDHLTRYIKGNADLVLQFAKDSLPGITPMPPDASFLVWLDARELDAKVGGIQKYLVDKAGVNLYEGRIYGPGGEGFIRINVGCPRPLLQEALRRIERALSQV
jgi:cystathionine beta-lyase